MNRVKLSNYSIVITDNACRTCRGSSGVIGGTRSTRFSSHSRDKLCDYAHVCCVETSKKKKEKKKWMAKKGLLPRKPWQIFVPCSVNANHPRRGMERMHRPRPSEQIRSLIYILMDLNWNLLDARLKINCRGGYTGYLLFILGCWLAWPCSCLVFFFEEEEEVAISNACRGYNYQISRWKMRGM